MITEDYCSFEVAKLLKEKGFEIDTNKDYWKIGEDGTMYFMSSIGAYTSNTNDKYAFYRPENSYPCPTHQTAMKWLREEHNKHCDIGYDIDLGWFFQIIDLKETVEYDYPEIKYYHAENETNFETYEEAVEAALKYCLENLV